jgi:cardiolipin synthase (CMP-forming)
VSTALSLPNLLSLLRMGLIPFFVIAVTQSDMAKALGVFVLAGVTDALDGFIARFWKQQTLLGTYLDPAADKLLLTSAYVVLTLDSLTPVVAIPLWVTILVIARDVLIVTTAAALHMALGTKRFPPTVLSKMTTGVQVVTVVLVLVANVAVETAWLGEAALWAVYLVAALTLASGLHYVARAMRASNPPAAS